MTTLYNSLGFPQNDPIMVEAAQPLSANVLIQMNNMPQLIKTWQKEDIENNNIGGYFQNPSELGINNTITAANNNLMYGNVIGSSPTITNILSNLYTTSNTLISVASNFQYHTDRMSNVTDMGYDMDNPHYELSIGYGKMIMYIVNQTDGIQNNSPMIGSFGSIFASNVINANANTFLSYSQLYLQSITSSTTIEGDPPTAITTNTSNISLSNAQTLYNTANNLYNLMTTHMSQDKQFYQNTKILSDKLNKFSAFNNIGQTETDLIMNHIGTEKIKTRLASQ